MEVMGYGSMNEVNEFNAITGEAVIRSFTAEEIKQNKLTQKAVADALLNVVKTQAIPE
jgi:hypothetical protein